MSLPEFLFERVTAEIHQQMDGVAALADRLARRQLDPEAQACVAGILEAAASVRQIVESAMDLRAATVHGLAFAPTSHRLREIMDQIEARWRARASDGGVRLLVSFDGEPDVCALVDSARLSQLFDGFIGLAVASVRRGAVEASLKAVHAEGGVRLEGRIRGGGERHALESADIRRIEARYGLETALGVTLSRRIVEGLSGALRSEANAGAGETIVFEFSAPLAQDDSVAPEAAPGPARAAHILVVDDNATNRMVAETLCEMFDCTSESAVDGVEAIEAARTGRFDLILMDIKMPRMDGVTATRTIRELPGRAGRVPIIALTANADPEDAQGYISAGMNGVVEKPMKPENLLLALQEALADSDAAEAA